MTTPFITCIPYALLGLGMVMPYTYLAGGNPESARLASWVLPVVSILLYALYNAVYRRKSATSEVFWLPLAYCLLPIFINGMSVVLKWAGMESLGDLVFKYRYASLLAVPLSILGGFAVYEYATRHLPQSPKGRDEFAPRLVLYK